jgi:hypothetical protein
MYFTTPSFYRQLEAQKIEKALFSWTNRRDE